MTRIFAQTASSGSVSGTVNDPQGAAVPGATVTLLDTATNTAHGTMTNEAGQYSFPIADLRVYDITVDKTGFKVTRALQQKVSASPALIANVMLEVGTLTETVVVSATSGTELQPASVAI